MTNWKTVVRLWIEYRRGTSTEFTLTEICRAALALGESHPRNHHVEAKIRQVLQELRDAGEIRFVGRGRYSMDVKPTPVEFKYVGSLPPSAHAAMRGTKRHRIADTRKPHAGGPIQHRRLPNLTEAEIAASEILCKQEFPAPRYIVMRAGGTPDFLIFDTHNKTPSGIIWREAKAGRDRLDVETQAPIMLLAEAWKADVKVLMMERA